MSPENVQEEQYEEQCGRMFAEEFTELATKETQRGVVAFKFGGTSLLGAKRMRHAAGLVKDALQTSRVVVVVSAMKGVTDGLLALAKLVETGDLSEAKRTPCFVYMRMFFPNCSSKRSITSASGMICDCWAAICSMKFLRRRT